MLSNQPSRPVKAVLIIRFEDKTLRSTPTETLKSQRTIENNGSAWSPSASLAVMYRIHHARCRYESASVNFVSLFLEEALPYKADYRTTSNELNLIDLGEGVRGADRITFRNGSLKNHTKCRLSTSCATRTTSDHRIIGLSTRRCNRKHYFWWWSNNSVVRWSGLRGGGNCIMFSKGMYDDEPQTVESMEMSALERWSVCLLFF